METSTIIRMITDKLSPYYPQGEIRGFINLIFEHLFGLSIIKIHLYQHDQNPDAKLSEIEEIIERLINYEPIQYILGETEFYGLKFKVNSAVLIPRPETEELVDWILQDSPGKNSTVLDIGTGSGCIAIALAKNRPDLHVEGWDISEEALEVARQNAETNNVNVSFLKVDILNQNIISEDKTYELIVSNPPYVTPSEKSSLLKNVIDHEPHTALFVPKNDPLIFYNEIADFGIKFLNQEGQLYFEINENLGNEVQSLLKSKRFANIVLRRDINGKDRMIRCEKKNGEQ